MTKLSELFDQNKDSLRNELNQAKDLEGSAKAIQNCLTDIHSQCIEELNPLQKQVVASSLHALKESTKFLPAVRKTKVFYTSEDSQYCSDESNQESLNLLSWLLKLFLSFLRKKDYDSTEEKNHREFHVEVVADSSDIVFYLKNALVDLDKVIEIIDKSQVEESKSLEDMLDILTFFQDLLSHTIAEDALSTLKEAKRVPALLNRYGIKVEYFNPDQQKEQEHSSRFEYEKASNPTLTSCKTTVPAFVKDKKLLLNGQVIEPSSFN